MKSSILILTIMFSCFQITFGQTDNSSKINVAKDINQKEEFINLVYLKFVDSSYTNYYLSENCTGVYIGQYDQKDLKSDFKNKIPETTLQVLLDKVKNDTIQKKWNCSLLKAASCITSDSIKYILPSAFLINTNPNWGKIKKEKQAAKKLDKQQEEFNKKPSQEKRIYYFSRPIFDDKQEYALITMSFSSGNLSGYGCTYLFKKTAGEWSKIAENSCRIS